MHEGVPPRNTATKESSVPKDRLVASVMFTDMVSYSAVAARDDAHAVRLLEEQRGIVRPLVKKHAGNEIKTIGDAFLVVFDSAANALSCALELQQTLRQRNLAHPDDPIRLRIGIHHGEIFRSPTDVLGDNVNIAARLYPLAEPGGICVSEKVVQEVEHKMEVRFVRLGAASLKNLGLKSVYAPRTVDSVSSVLLRGRFAMRQQRWRRAFVAALLLVAGLLVAVAYYNNRVPRVDLVAIADVKNDTRDPVFDGLSGMISTALEQSRRLRVVPRTRMLDVLRAEAGSVDRLDEEAARRAARVDGVRMLLVPRIASNGKDDYGLEVRAVDVETGRTWVRVADGERGRERIQTLIDRVSAKLRLELFEREQELESDRVSVGDATTTSLEAYQHYFSGVEFLNAWNVAGAEKELLLAVKIDPDFALAHMELAYVYWWNLDSRARPALDRALALQNRIVGRRERGMLGVLETRIGGDDEGAIARLNELLRDYPSDKVLLFELGDVHFHRSEFAEAAEIFDRVVTLDPLHQRGREHAIWAFYGAGRHEEARAQGEAYVTRSPGERSFSQLVDALAAMGRFDQAHATLARARVALPEKFPAPPTALDARLAMVERWEPGFDRDVPGAVYDLRIAAAVLEGRIEDALKVTVAGRRKVEPILGARVGLEAALVLAVHRPGRAAEVSRLARVGLDAETLQDPYSVLLVAACGLAGDAKCAYEGASKQPGVALAHLAKGLEARASGDHAAALEELAATRRFIQLRYVPFVLAREAEEHLASGNAPEAEALARRALDIRIYTSLWPYTRNEARLTLARALDAQGKRDEAAKEWRALLALWKNADADFPPLVEAKKALAR